MEFFFLGPQETLIYFVIITLICFYMTRNPKNNGVKSPEPGSAWPILGHLHHLLGSDKIPHRALAAMADKYGAAFFMRLGIHKTLVVSSWEAAKECFTTNDKVFPTRPKSIAVKHMGYNHALLGFAPYGPYWRNLRKIAASNLLSSIRLEHLKRVRDTETNLFIRELYEKFEEKGKRVLVDIKEMFGDLGMNIIVRMVAGKRYSGADKDSRRCQKALGEFSRLEGMFFISDSVPYLGWIDVLKGNIGEMKRTARELDYLLGKWVKEHHQKRVFEDVKETKKDFIHVMLSVLDDGKSSSQEIETVIKATCLSLISGASDSIKGTLTWTLSLLLNNRKVLKKVQEELNNHVGKHRNVDEPDIKNLNYLQAVVKETLRLYPATPIIPREALEDCVVAGLNVPKGTRLLVNLWKIHRDPQVWSKPDEFVPMRFLAQQDSTRDFEYMPFGFGRRMCPGGLLGIQVIHLTLARLLHAFEFETVSDKQVDMSEGPGLILPKATALEVIITPRLPAKYYLK